MFAFVLSDCTTTNVFLAGISFIFATFLFVLTYCSPEVYVLQDADGRVSPYFGEHMVFTCVLQGVSLLNLEA
ncbi:unnamed protein product [Brassica rapa subsp. narinosa]